MASNKIHIDVVSDPSVDQLVVRGVDILGIERMSTAIIFGFGGRLVTEPVNLLRKCLCLASGLFRPGP